MTARLDPVLDVLTCPACGRALTAADGAVACTDGHTYDLLAGAAPDLAGDDVVQPDSLGQLAMRFKPLVDIYESIWRPLFTLAAGGTNPDEETKILLDWLDVGSDARLLDVACGPGNTTRRLAAGVTGGRVVGLDLSRPMLQQAVNATDGDAPIGFARVDVHRIPAADDSFDGAHCAAALYLLSEPEVVIAEIARVLRPGARFVGMTLVSPVPAVTPAARRVRRLAQSLSGLRYFGAGELGEMCAAADLVEFHAERRGGALLFRARKP